MDFEKNYYALSAATNNKKALYFTKIRVVEFRKEYVVGSDSLRYPYENLYESKEEILSEIEKVLVNV